MSKKKLIDKLNEQGVRNANEVVAGLIKIITAELKETGKFKLPGIGIFEIQNRPARVVKSFGKRVEVAAQKKLKFRASVTIKKALNG